MRVAAVDDDITLLDAGVEESLDEVVYGLTGLDEQHHPSWLLQQLDELFDRVCADDRLALGLCIA